MKRVGLVVAGLVSRIHADFGSIEDIVKELNKNITSFQSDRPQGNLLRGGVTPASLELELLSCYGCWCYRGQHHGKGLGRPVNDFDKICRQHHHAYECIKLDAVGRGEVCDPVQRAEEGFGYKMSTDLDEDGHGGMKLECQDGQDWCSQRTCEVDLEYLRQMWQLLLAGQDIHRIENGHHNKHRDPDGNLVGTFDTTNCPIGGKQYQPYKHCCGKYPKRQVFKSSAEVDGHRQCCDLEDGTNDGTTKGRPFLIDEQTCCGSSGILQQPNGIC